MTNVTLGTMPTDVDERDAIHVAVIPMVAGEDLDRGDRVGIYNGQAFTTASEIVGIVDPFLPDGVTVEQGTRFWLCLLPNTVTGMRHHWSHPAFDRETKPPITKEESEQWLRDFCKTHDVPSYEVTVAAALGEHVPGYADYYDGAYRIVVDGYCGDYLLFRGRDAHADIPPEFWDHVENATGKKCPHRVKHFSCTC